MLAGMPKDGQGGPEDASAGPAVGGTMVRQALPQPLFEQYPLETLSVPAVTLKGSHWASSGAGAKSLQACPGQRQATTLLFKGFTKAQTSGPGRMARS